MKNLYLPNLKKIIIHKYTLYQQVPSYEFEFIDGINSVVGVNGIGKTTFVNLITYCLVGHKKKRVNWKKIQKKTKYKYIEEDFFSTRINNMSNDEENSLAEISLEYYLGKDKILIKRSLINNTYYTLFKY